MRGTGPPGPGQLACSKGLSGDKQGALEIRAMGRYVSDHRVGDLGTGGCE